MENEHDIIIILDSIVDDYYFLWECFEDYKRVKKLENYSKNIFIKSLIEAYEKKYFNFFIGENFVGEEKLIPKFNLNNLTIEELLDYRNDLSYRIRVTISFLGIKLLKAHENKYL